MNTLIKSFKKAFLFPLPSLFFLLLLAAPSAHAASSATFAWDASDGAVRYKVYQSSTSNVYNQATGQVCDVTALTCIVNGLPDNSTFYFVATALDASGNESAFSNQVTLITTDTIPPNPPGNFRGIINRIIAWFKGIFGVKSFRAVG